jgi:hypothetical protein
MTLRENSKRQSRLDLSPSLLPSLQTTGRNAKLLDLQRIRELGSNWTSRLPAASQAARRYGIARSYQPPEVD